jgi:DNA-binding NtrC family response regulator
MGRILIVDNELQRLDGTAELLIELLPLLGVREQMLQTAPTSVPVLITGERGSGKELVAHAIHQRGPRSGKPFRVLNCASPAAGLEENEPFERAASGDGAGTAFHEGTLFLDRVEELSLSAQERLARLLNDAKSSRMRSHEANSSEVRVLAATHCDLSEQVKAGLFRDDLYEALAAVRIALRPLREHPSDIAALCELFLRQMAADFNLPKRRLSVQALARLQAYTFPGNIRELRNLIERAVILAPGEQIGPEYFAMVESVGASPSHGNGAGEVADLSWVESLPSSFDLRTLLSTVEKTLIERTLQATRGAQAEAARRLGLSRSDLSYKLLKYELRKESPAPSRVKTPVVS